MKIAKEIIQVMKIITRYPAVKITTLYVLFGFIWILLSDKFLMSLVHDPNLVSELQTYKGWFFILITAVLLYHLVSDSFVKVNDIKEDLEANEKRYQTIFDNYRDVYFELNRDGILEEISPSVFDIYGFKRHEIIGEHFSEIISFNVKYVNIFNYLFKNKINKEIELKIIDNFGKQRFCTINSVFLTDIKDNLKIVGSIHDITERKQTELFLQKMSLAVEQSPNITMITDTNGSIEYVNPRFCEITGYSFEEAVGRNPRFLNSNTKNQEFYKDLWDTILAGNTWEGLLNNFKKNGQKYSESAFIAPLKNDNGEVTHFIKVANDVTELKKSQLKLKELLHQKELLLQEVYHRTKNNMQLISSILKLENRFTTKKEIKPFIKSINNRIMAMAMIHDRIYQSNDLDSIDLQHYLFGFVPYLLKDYEILVGDIELKMDIENIKLNANIIITIGLLLNEMISVSLHERELSGCNSIEIGFKEKADIYEINYLDSNNILMKFLELKEDNISSKMIEVLTNQLKGQIELDKSSGMILLILKKQHQRTFNKV